MDDLFNINSSVSSAASAFSTGLDNLASQIAADRRQKKQIEAQKELQKSQNQFNYEMWLENNQYNSPENQIELYRRAGLNPQMFIQGFDATSGSPAQSTGVSVPAYAPAPDYKSPVDSYLKLYQTILGQQSLQLENQRVQLEKSKVGAEVNKINEEAFSLKIDNELKPYINDSRLELLRNDIKKVAAETSSLLSDVDVKAATAKLRSEQMTTEKIMRKYNINKLVSETMLNNAHYNLTDKQSELLSKQIISYILDNGMRAQRFHIGENEIIISKNNADASGIQLDILKLNKKMLQDSANSSESEWLRKHPIITELIKTTFSLIGEVAKFYVGGKAFGMGTTSAGALPKSQNWYHVSEPHLGN